MIGLVELIIIVIVVALIARAVVAPRGSGTSSTASSGPSQAHPHLKHCPGCGAPLNDSTDSCSHCGLRISV